MRVHALKQKSVATATGIEKSDIQIILAFRVMAIKWNEIAFAIVGADYLCFIFIAYSFILYHCADVIYLFRLLFYYKLFELLHTHTSTQCHLIS